MVASPPFSLLPQGFSYRGGVLHCEGVSLLKLAQRFGTPLYVYSLSHIEGMLSRFREAFSGVQPLLAYAVKANDNPAILRLFAGAGVGFDIVSLGEYMKVCHAGGDPYKVVFSGVGKTPEELKETLGHGLHCLNMESEEEARVVVELARGLKKKIPVAIRVNPEVEASTHPHIRTGHRGSKFGLPWREALPLYEDLARVKEVEVRGIAAHIGSQILEVEPFLEALSRLLEYREELRKRGIVIAHLDLGGGVGIPYRPEERIFPLEEYGEGVQARLPRDLALILEPGRALVGNAGVLLTRVLYRKPVEGRTYLVVDAAMTELIRPMLYHAYHGIVPLVEGGETELVDLVGPVCESTDVLGKERLLPVMKAGDYLAILSAGAYGSVMASNYNNRLRPAEVVVQGERFALSRERERYLDLFQRDLPYLFWEE